MAKLGYHNSVGAWRHSDRQAIFVGDFIDRGPAQLPSVDTVRRMVDSGSALAVMGNHELNAIAWHTPDPRQPGEYLRPHHSAKYGEKNREQHAAFLAEVEDHPARHSEIIDWFLTLPLWLDLPEFRVVHACWHPRFIAWLSPRLHGGRFLTGDLMVEAVTEPGDVAKKDDATPSIFNAVEALTKGMEVSLPDGYTFFDKDGHERKRVRTRWWDEGAVTYRSAAILSPEVAATLPDMAIPTHARVEIEDKPVFFGHYWLTGKPWLQSERAACVDYSAGKGGALVAYRFDGESNLSSDHFVSVP